MNVDFGKTASEYSKYRAGFPAEAKSILAESGLVFEGRTVLDLGTGAANVLDTFAAGSSFSVGIDFALPLLLSAAHPQGRHFVKSSAEVCPVVDGYFDVVTAGQCWHWFDGPAVARQAFRALKPGGRVLIAHFDWLPLAGNVVEATERLIVARTPSVHGMAGGNGLYPAWQEHLHAGGFIGIGTVTFDKDVPFSHEAWRGRIRASAGVGASLGPGEIAEFDLELQSLLESKFPKEPMQVPHRFYAVFGRKPRSAD